MGRAEKDALEQRVCGEICLTLRRRASCTISGRIRHELGRALSADNAMTTTFSHDAFAPDSRPSGPRPGMGQPDRLRCSLLSRPDILPASTFVARARTLASLGLKIVAVWEQNSPDPENLSYSSGDSDAFSAYIFLVWRAARESHPTIAVALQWSVSQVRASELRCWMSAIGAPRTVALMLQLSAKR